MRKDISLISAKKIRVASHQPQLCTPYTQAICLREQLGMTRFVDFRKSRCRMIEIDELEWINFCISKIIMHLYEFVDVLTLVYKQKKLGLIRNKRAIAAQPPSAFS